MTREEALKHANNKLSETLSKVDLVHKIYDDFELRSCESCKYWNPSEESIFESNGDGYIDCDIVYAESNGTINKSNFCCNKWEQK